MCLRGEVVKREAPDAAALAVRNPQLLTICRSAEAGGLGPGSAIRPAVRIPLGAITTETLCDARADIVPPNLMLPGQCYEHCLLLLEERMLAHALAREEGVVLGEGSSSHLTFSSRVTSQGEFSCWFWPLPPPR